MATRKFDFARLLARLSDTALVFALVAALQCAAVSFFIWRAPVLGDSVVFTSGGRMSPREPVTSITVWRAAGRLPGGSCRISFGRLAAAGGMFVIADMDSERAEGFYGVRYSGPSTDTDGKDCGDGSMLMMDEPDMRDLVRAAFWERAGISDRGAPVPMVRYGG